MVLYGMPRASRKQTWYFPTSSTPTLRVYFHTAVSGSCVAPAFGHPKLNGKDAVVALEPLVLDGTVTWYVRPSRKEMSSETSMVSVLSHVAVVASAKSSSVPQAPSTPQSTTSTVARPPFGTVS